MQVSATLIAAQAAAREARSRLALPEAVPQAKFAAAVEKTAADGTAFSALPLRQLAAKEAPAPVQLAPPARMGQNLDITV